MRAHRASRSATRVRRVAVFVAACVLAPAFVAAPRRLAAQAAPPPPSTHVVIVTGLGGEAAYTEAFRAFADTLAHLAGTRWQVAADRLHRLGDTATRRSIRETFLAVGEAAAPDDRVLVFLQGHGSGAGTDSRLAIRGADLTAGDLATWLGALRARTIAVVHAGSGSGDFADVLAGPGRVVVTATRSATERNATRFGPVFTDGLRSGEADLDKDGRLSLLEAFTFTDSTVARAYEGEGLLRTEHARLSDPRLASTVVLGPPSQVVSPLVAARLAVRDSLADEVRALRARRETLDAPAYRARLEALLVAIVAETRAIRAAGGAP